MQQQQQSTSGPAQHTRTKTTGMAPASATPRASAYKTASKALVTENELVAPEPSTQNDDDFVYIRVPRERMASVDKGLIETVQHQVSQSAGPQNAAPVLHSVPVQLPAPAPQQSCGDPSTISCTRVSVLQPGGNVDTNVDTVEAEPHLEALTQHVAGRLAVPGNSAAAEVKVLVDSGSGNTAVSEELLEALQGQPGMTQTALTQAFVGYARVVTSLGQACDDETQSCPLHLTIETPWGPVRFTMPFMVLPGGGDLVIIGQKTLKERLGIDVMAQLKASALKAHGCQDDAGMKFTALAVGEPNAGAVLRAAISVTVCGPGRDPSGDVEDEVTLTLLSQRPMVSKDSEMEMQDRVVALETAVNDVVDHGLPPECAKMLRDIVFRTHLYVFRRALLDDPPARVEPMTVRLQPGARAMRANPRASPPANAAWLHQHVVNMETAGMVFRNRQAIYASVAMATPKGPNSYRMVTDYRAVNDTIEPAAMTTPNLKDTPFIFAGETAWCTLDMLRGYWQVPLSEDAQEMFTLVTPEGLFTTRLLSNRCSRSVNVVNVRLW